VKRLLIAGSRTINPTTPELDSAFGLLLYHLDEQQIVVVHGNARGVDKAGGVWAQSMGYPVEIFEPDWKKNGRGAGYIRNQEMVDTGIGAAFIFWDGSSKGTAHTLKLLEENGIPRVVVVR